MSQSQYTNIAFISYKREYEEWARWLQNKQEHYNAYGDNILNNGIIQREYDARYNREEL